MNFTFDEKITKPVLENYLSRSVTASGLYASDTLEDDLRALKRIGAKFLGFRNLVYDRAGGGAF